jgi:two-component system OmpR family sensor kinase
MSSNQGSKNRLSSWSLRARLIATMVALLAVVSLIIGVVTTLSLRDYLYDQVDSQVVAGTSRFLGGGGGKPDQKSPPLLIPGQPEDTMVVQLDGSKVEKSERVQS